MNNKILNIVDKNKTVEEDFDFARSTVYNLADKSTEAIDLMMEVARESEHPRAFEVLSNMIKQNADLAEQLLIMQQRKDKIETKDKKEEETKRITNNNVFVGTTADLQRLLLKSDEEKIIDNDE